MSGAKIKDFDIAKNCLILCLTDGRVFMGNMTKISHSANIPKRA